MRGRPGHGQVAMLRPLVRRDEEAFEGAEHTIGRAIPEGWRTRRQLCEIVRRRSSVD